MEKSRAASPVPFLPSTFSGEEERVSAKMWSIMPSFQRPPLAGIPKELDEEERPVRRRKRSRGKPVETASDRIRKEEEGEEADIELDNFQMSKRHLSDRMAQAISSSLRIDSPQAPSLFYSKWRKRAVLERMRVSSSTLLLDRGSRPRSPMSAMMSSDLKLLKMEEKRADSPFPIPMPEPVKPPFFALQSPEEVLIGELSPDDEYSKVSRRLSGSLVKGTPAALESDVGKSVSAPLGTPPPSPTPRALLGLAAAQDNLSPLPPYAAVSDVVRSRSSRVQPPLTILAMAKRMNERLEEDEL